MNERWVAVEGYEDKYQVSDMGRVRSIDHWVTYVDGRRRIHKGRVLSAGTDRGYKFVNLYRNSTRNTRKVHHLVLAAFVGPRLDGMEVHHINGIRDDNRVENLTYLSHEDNMKLLRKRS